MAHINIICCAYPAIQAQVSSIIAKHCLFRMDLLPMALGSKPERFMSSNNKYTHSQEDISEDKKSEEFTIADKIPEEPTTCCMSGCANCVWIQYAEELSKLYKDGGKKAREVILNQVTDPNIKAFLLTELKTIIKEET